ncbi:MAG: cupin domain-containing protein [Candidatus Latescibacterota bacterium]|nr:MAG: cupin domain-containing protein [Candidatus Latescibacterota bacterium]
MTPEILDTQCIEWREFMEAPGVRYKVLRHHDARRGITLLLRFDAGASYPTHRHPKGEEYYVLDGTLRDGAQTYGAHTFVYHPPGSVHHPSSPDGCTLLITLPAHIERTDV